ncbi:APC family permease [Mycolicibacterium sp. YH-1]|uniref:APC family permease n=1 Tax=Mycolicibacterium sp. YH-1 TaxID=2908837 RepID=UPI001F4BF28D|nr:APC family permease [Mycolicibacterium sp. YH-1]UNB53143.1 APC family permease [Mycolicibacterium sp. YH-1]
MTASTTGTERGAGNHFDRTMTWRAALSLALALPASALAVIGYWTGALGGWAASALLVVSSIIAILQNFSYAEMAAMFPDKAGGIGLYANEAWKPVFRPAGALAAAGYWVGWSFGLSANALVIGGLLQAQWFSDVGFMVEAGPIHLGIGHFIALLAMFAVWLLNVFGIEPAVKVSYAVNTLVVVVMVAVSVTSVVKGKFHLDNVTWSLHSASNASPLVIAAVWLFLMGWTVYGTEIVATFTPEYRNPRSDVPKALTAAGILSLIIFALLPVVSAGTVGEAEIAANPLGFNVAMFEQLFGPAASLAIVVVCLSLLNLMSVCLADSGRALYGMAESGLTIQQLGVLNRWRSPGRALTVGMIVNVGLVVFVGNLLGVVFTANLGYMTTVILTLGGYLLLRRSNIAPDREFRMPSWWNRVTVLLLVINLVFFTVAATHPTLTGYGGWKEELIAFGLLGIALALYGYHRFTGRRAGDQEE